MSNITWESGYYRNGKFWCEAPYVNGRVHGLARSWYENGQLQCETPYVNGRIHGLARSWHENGQLLFEVLWVKGIERPDLIKDRLSQVVLFGKVLVGREAWKRI